MTRRQPQDVELVKQNLLRGLAEEFGKEPDTGLLLAEIANYIKERHRKFVLNRIDGLTPIEAANLYQSIIDGAKLQVPEAVEIAEVKVEEAKDNGQKKPTRKSRK